MAEGAAPSSAPASAIDRGNLHRLDHLRALFTQTPATLTGNAVGLGLILLLFAPSAPPGPMAAWGALVSVMLVLRLLHYIRYRRHPRANDATLRRWRTSWSALVLMQGALWGVAVWLFWDLGTPYDRLALLLIVYSYCLGSVQLLSTQWPVFLAFISLVLVPTIVRVATDTSEPGHWQLAGILTLLFGITVLMARTAGTALGQAIRLKSRTDALALQLRIEKSEAEAARRAAEAASRAKTQFFAAASHDLRQPLHAMGLFAETLRQRIHDPEVASLVNSINESVDALEGLFGELLDITRIDTGGVDVNPAPVRLKELFARLRLHFEPVAFEKGLALRFRGERHVVHADPLLLERILRNLVSNAIRYTDDGGVLVSCRPVQGHMRVQVWDSGVGIPQAQLPRIFDEFFQVQGHRPLQAHQRKGLGLGLAIVKRLAELMGTTIGVQSRVGHGTVFTLELPPGKATRPIEPAPSGARRPVGLTLESRQLVVVEDEPAVREGLIVLLQAWGASVWAFDTAQALQSWLASRDPAQAPPDLLLVDYRLPDGATGLDALAAVRAAWPQSHVPAIIITGSSLGGHEHEAEAHDFHLLVKPVVPNKLRAMIAFKLSER